MTNINTYLQLIKILKSIPVYKFRLRWIILMTIFAALGCVISYLKESNACTSWLHIVTYQPKPKMRFLNNHNNSVIFICMSVFMIIIITTKPVIFTNNTTTQYIYMYVSVYKILITTKPFIFTNNATTEYIHILSTIILELSVLLNE